MLQRDLVVIDNDKGIVRTDWDSPSPMANFNQTLSLEEKEYPKYQRVWDTILHCLGRFVIAKVLKQGFVKIRLVMAISANELGKWEARAKDGISSPAGDQVNEVQTITITGNNPRTFMLSFPFYGSNPRTGTLTTTELTAAKLQSSLELLPNIGKGNIAVTGAGPFVVTFQNKLGNGDVPLLEVVPINAEEGTVVVATTTPGSAREAVITESPIGQRSSFDLIVGDRNDFASFSRYNNCAVTSLNIRGRQGAKVLVEVLCYAASVEELEFFNPPQCIDFKPIYTQDCAVELNGDSINNELVDFEDTYNLKLETDEDAYPFNSSIPYKWEAVDPEFSTKLTLKGNHTHPTYKLGMVADDPETGVSTAGLKLFIGKPGARVVLNKPYGFIETDDEGGLAFPNSRHARFGVTFTPTISNDHLDSPETVRVHNGQADNYLVSV